MKIRLLTLFAVLSSLAFLKAQNNVPFEKQYFKDDKEGFKIALDNLMDGNDFFEDSAFNSAVKYYLKAYEFNPNNAELNYKIGICYINSVNTYEALNYFQKAYDLYNDPPKEIKYYIARSYQSQLLFDKAIEQYNEFKISLSPNVLYNWYPTIKKRIEECEVGKKMLEKPSSGIVINLRTINSEYAEYCPLISADESMMIFTSKRIGTTGGMRDPYNMEFYEDIWVSYKENNSWSEPVNIGPPVNTEYHDATVGLSPDGQELYIYKGDKKKGDIKPGDIYVCELQGSEWSQPKRLSDNINSPYKESSASISFDGRTLYFVSNRPGGYGGLDIYYSERSINGEWGPAKNIGDVINTPYDEEGVFAHPDGISLYFSSKGHENMGGYDIFKSVKDENGVWSTPVNLGYPLNSADDDVYFVMSADGKNGYFSSVKPIGKGEKDIYQISFNETVKDITTTNLTLVKGVIMDAQTNKPIAANIEITDNSKNEVVSVFKSNSETGAYLVSLPAGKNYGIAVTADGYLFHSENFNIPKDQLYDKVELNIKMEKISEGSKTILNNIFFDYASSELKKESIAELNRIVQILKDNPSMKIEIGGHTDNQSSLATNQRLSTERAKAVVDYLISKGIDKSRLQYKGYAFYHPIASNDTPEGQAKNRRVEFKIISK
ncbi:MAG: OmpA family protein [Marinilabiliales bacterium]